MAPLVLLPLLLVAHLAHEAFHAIAATLVGLSDHRWRLGFGAARGQPRGSLEVRRFPIGLFYDLDHAPLLAAPRWKQAVVVGAGPALSWLASFVVLLAWLWGLPSGHEPAVIASVAPGSPAALAALQPGDTITHFAQAPVRDFQELRSLVEAHAGGVATVVYLRGGARYTAQVELLQGLRLGVLPTIESTGARALVGALVGTVMLPMQFLSADPGAAGSSLAWRVVLAYATAALLFTLLPLLPAPGFDGARLLRLRRRREG